MIGKAKLAPLFSSLLAESTVLNCTQSILEWLELAVTVLLERVQKGHCCTEYSR